MPRFFPTPVAATWPAIQLGPFPADNPATRAARATIASGRVVRASHRAVARCRNTLSTAVQFHRGRVSRATLRIAAAHAVNALLALPKAAELALQAHSAETKLWMFEICDDVHALQDQVGNALGLRPSVQAMLRDAEILRKGDTIPFALEEGCPDPATVNALIEELEKLRYRASLRAIANAEGVTPPQLTPASAPETTSGVEATDGFYMPAAWYRSTYGIGSSRLRTAKMRNPHLLRTKGPKHRPLYSVADVCRLWPEDTIGSDGEDLGTTAEPSQRVTGVTTRHRSADLIASDTGNDERSRHEAARIRD